MGSKVKIEKKEENFPLMHLGCKFGHSETSTFQGLHIAVTTQNCDILSKSGLGPKHSLKQSPTIHLYYAQFFLLA